MTNKLITLNNHGEFEEVNKVSEEEKYIVDEKGFPIVVNNQGNFVVLDEYDIINNELVVYSYGGCSWEYKQEVPYSTVRENTRGSNALRFILED